MNRALFITVGILAIIIVFLVWLFLFLYGAPSDTREVFSDLGIVEPVERPVATSTPAETGSNAVVLNLADGALQQVTTNPVAGFGMTTNSRTGTTTSTESGKGILRFVERGTGYVFEINLNSGLQTQVTPTTLPNTVAAYFSPDLERVVVVTERSGRQVTLVELPDNADSEASLTSLDAAAQNIQFIDDDTLTYTRNSFTETVGYTYTVGEQTVAERFRLSIPDATVLTTENNNVFAYPKPTASLAGALYEVESDGLLPASDMAPGLVPFIGGGIGVVNQVADGVYRTYRLPNYTEQPITMLPEKCAASAATSSVICGAPEPSQSEAFVEEWYKGVVRSNDLLWNVDTASGEATSLMNPVEVTGRQIDVTQMNVSPNGGHALFVNKIDATLWLFSL